MLIGVDAGCLGIKDKRLQVGVYQTTKNLLLELSKIDKKNKYILYSFYPISKELMNDFGRGMENKILNSFGWLSFQLPINIIKDRVNVFLAPSQAIPKKYFFSPPFKTIGFMYDLAFEKFKDMYPDSYNKLSKNSKYLIKNSDKIIAVSNSSKKDIIDRYNTASYKIIVSYQGVSDIFNPKGEKYSIDKYFLFVGALKRIKNVPTIIKAFSYFLDKTKQKYYLYLTGGDKWIDPTIQKTIDEAPQENIKLIKFLGFVDDNTLVKLYRGATAFVSPSFYEGFGLTILQAMKSGCPVIASNTGSIPEIVGDSGILTDSNDYIEIGKQMIKIAEDKKLREEYIQKGLKQSEKFTLRNFSETVLKEINNES